MEEAAFMDTKVFYEVAFFLTCMVLHLQDTFST